MQEAAISKKPLVRVNEQIQADTVRLISVEGKQIGLVPIKEALAAAAEKSLDLVEVAPDTQHPVCRIMDYGKKRYNKQKKTKGKVKKSQHLKEIKLRPLTQEHDIEVKVRNIRKFLTQGDKVKISMIFRGRERSQTNLGIALLTTIAEELEDSGVVEVAPKIEGRDLFMLIIPK